ncbi:MAG: DUF2804 domain-containing protein [Lachnospiraceae bacterium]|nr:DUF2804 domain-containing protein [Lachnospiraceae bacterium]
MRNHEITTVQSLLDEKGGIAEPGWSRKQYQVYRRTDIRAASFRIKEWDYYLVVGKDFAGAFTISDDGYIGLQSVSLLKLGAYPWEHTETVLNVMPMGKLKLPENSSEGNVVYEDRRLSMRFEKTYGRRRIVCSFRDFFEKKPFSCDIRLEQPEMDTMVIATPFDRPKHFYYNQKINCMRASGWMEFDGERYTFDPETDFGTLDWGRGVWTYDNTWLWGSGNADLDGHSFGFNIGYGFGNTSAASENAVFYDGKAHKLDDVIFHIPKDDIMKPWTFTSSDGRFETSFTPVLDRAAKLDFKVLVSDQHQVFGRMSGRTVLDDGTVLEFKDILCFAEKVHNRY